MRISAGKLALYHAIAAAAFLLLSATAIGAPKYFQSPSGNIGCGISRDGARCDVREHSWKAPPKPKSCRLDWGYGLTVGKSGKSSFFCAGDSVLGVGSTLPYGQSVRRGRFKCTSRTDGVRCVNVRNKHGFKLARDLENRF